MAICDSLSSAYSHNCLYPEAPGASDELLLIPIVDLDTSYGVNGILFNATNPMIVEGIKMKTGKMAYAFLGKRNPNAIRDTPTEVEGSMMYLHGVSFNFYEHTATTATQLKQLANSPVIAILKTNQRDSTGSNQYKVAGVQVGLYLKEGTYNSSENQGIRAVSLETLSGLYEPNPLSLFFLTDLVTTNALYAALKVAAV